MKSIRVFQIKVDENNKETIYKKFSSWEFMKSMNMDFDPSIYLCVFEGLLAVNDLEEVYMALQGTKPQGYKGHSLSVSDLVEIDGKIYYCDSYGFKDVTKKCKSLTRFN